MRTQALLFALVGIALAVAGDVPANAAAASVAYTPQDKFLARSPFGNFACKVNGIVVSTDNPGLLDVPEQEKIDAANIRAAFENVATLEWAHIAQASFSSFDGRNDEKILGTPGGDMGEFIQAIAAFSKVAKKTLSQAEVSKLFEKYLKTMTRQKFFYETDEVSYTKLAVATGCRNLHVADMGGMKRKREAFLERVAEPDHIGDPFIKFLATNATSLDLDSKFIHSALAAYHNVLWTNPNILSTKLCYLETKGARNTERAIVNIKTPSFCIDQGLAPMVSPLISCKAPVFVNHPDAVRVFRRELVAVMTEGVKDVDPRDVMAAYNLMAETNAEKFLSYAAPLLPVFTVSFVNTASVLTEDENEFAKRFSNEAL